MCLGVAEDSTAVQVVRGMVASRQGVQDKIRDTSVFSELVKLLPADLFRACLAQASSSSQRCKWSLGAGSHLSSLPSRAPCRICLATRMSEAC